jgi:type I restriction enzyme S subunit
MSKMRLKEVCDLITKGTTPTTIGHSYTNEGINFIKSESITNSKFLNNTIYEHIDKITDAKMKRSRIKENDLLISIAGIYLGKIAIARNTDIPANTNQAVAIVRLNKKKVDVDYIYYYLSQTHINKHINNLSSQSSQPNLNLDLLGEIEFDYKKLDKQKKISSLLSLIDHQIIINEKINNDIEKITKIIYDYWFVQFDFPDENDKPYKKNGGTLIWNNKLKKKIPTDWSSILISNLLEREKNIKQIPSSEIQIEGKIPVIDQSMDFISGYTNDSESLIKIREPKIIFGDHTRALKLINFDFAKGADGTKILLSNNKRMPQHLFYLSLSKIDLSNYGYARHFQFLKDIDIILPSLDIAKKFESLAQINFDEIKKNVVKNIELSKFKNLLLPLLINEKINVN